MAAEEWVVLVKESDGRYREVAQQDGSRPVAESDFEALEMIPPDVRMSEMYAVRSARITTFILIPEGDRPTEAELVKVLPDGTLLRTRTRTPAEEPPATPTP